MRVAWGELIVRLPQLTTPSLCFIHLFVIVDSVSMACSATSLPYICWQRSTNGNIVHHPTIPLMTGGHFHHWPLSYFFFFSLISLACRCLWQSFIGALWLIELLYFLLARMWLKRATLLLFPQITRMYDFMFLLLRHVCTRTLINLTVWQNYTITLVSFVMS